MPGFADEYLMITPDVSGSRLGDRGSIHLGFLGGRNDHARLSGRRLAIEEVLTLGEKDANTCGTERDPGGDIEQDPPSVVVRDTVEVDNLVQERAVSGVCGER